MDMANILYGKDGSVLTVNKYVDYRELLAQKDGFYKKEPHSKIADEADAEEAVFEDVSDIVVEEQKPKSRGRPKAKQV